MPVPQPDKLRIVLYPDPVLKKSCAPVTEFGAGVRAVAERMIELMREAPGVGLAAPQIGWLARLFVCNLTGEAEDSHVYVNPVFSEPDGVAEAEEGCLSLPGVLVTMRRAQRIVMRAQDLDGRPVTVAGEDLQARIWQHEVDHLEGRLIVDSMSTSDEIANRRALKQFKADYASRR